MYYWHWAKIKDPKTKKLVPKRQHGLQLQPRWDGTGAPPLLRHPPHIGLPALETTHPFHFKLSPGMLLGPQCNHDLAVLLRLCDLPEDAPDAKLDEDHVAVVKAAMVEAMGDHEFYAGAFGERRHRAHAQRGCVLRCLTPSKIVPAMSCDVSGPFQTSPRSVLRRF